MIDPAVDKDTQYLTRECFQNQKLPHYIEISKTSQQPFGVMLLNLGVPHRSDTEDARKHTALQVKSVIDSICLESSSLPGARIQFDVRAREAEQYHLLMRVADELECMRMCALLQNGLAQQGYTTVRLVARSYNAALENVTPETVMSELEKALS